MAQHRVTGGMAAGVVDQLEVVQVDRQHAAAHLRVALRAVKLKLQPVHQATPVGQAGEVVCAGLVVQLAAHQHPLGDVLEAGVHLVEQTVAKQRRGVHQQPGAAAAGHGHAHHHVQHRLTGAQRHHRGVLVTREIAVILTQRLPARVDRLQALQLRQCQPQDAQRRRVGRSDAAQPVLVDHALRHRFEQRAVFFFAGFQPGFHLLAHRYVGQHAGPHHLARRVGAGAGLDMHPLQQAAGGADAVFMRPGPAALHGGLRRCIVGRLVLGQDAGAQRVDVAAGLLGRQLEQGLQARAEIDKPPALASAVHQPEHRPRDRCRQVEQQRLALAQGLLGQLQRGDVVVRHHKARRHTARNARYPRQKPALLGGRVAGVLQLELRALAAQHLPQQRGKRCRLGTTGAVGTVGAVGAVVVRAKGRAVAHRQVVGALVHLIMRGGAGRCKVTPGLVDGDHRAGVVQHTHVGGQPVQHRLQKLRRRGQRQLYPLARRDVDHRHQAVRQAVGAGHPHRFRQHGVHLAVAPHHLPFALQFTTVDQKALVQRQHPRTLVERKHVGEQLAQHLVGRMAVHRAIGRVHTAEATVEINHRDADRRLVDHAHQHGRRALGASAHGGGIGSIGGCGGVVQTRRCGITAHGAAARVGAPAAPVDCKARAEFARGGLTAPRFCGVRGVLGQSTPEF